MRGRRTDYATLRRWLILAELQVATVRTQLMPISYADFENFYDFKPSPPLLQSWVIIFAVAFGIAGSPPARPLSEWLPLFAGRH